MDGPKTPPVSEPGTLRLRLDVPRVPGDRVAAVVDAVAQTAGHDVKLVALRYEPVCFEFHGPKIALERLRTSVMHDALRSTLGSCRLSVQLASSATPRPGRSLVLLADADQRRSRTTVEHLGRANIEVCVVGRGAAVQSLLLRTALPFDAVVMYHRLGDVDGTELLTRIIPEQRPCSVLIFDDHPTSALNRRYRALGAYRYAAPPNNPLQLIGRVHDVIGDTQAWHTIDDPNVVGEPPPQFLDPQMAANRLRFMFALSQVERDVAFMLLMGERDMAIARHLKKSERTAKRHVGRVLEKAGIQNRSSLWAVLYRDGNGKAQRVEADEDLRLADGPPHKELVFSGEKMTMTLAIDHRADTDLTSRFVSALERAYPQAPEDVLSAIQDRNQARGQHQGRTREQTRPPQRHQQRHLYPGEKRDVG